jgi:hypothetical protein
MDYNIVKKNTINNKTFNRSKYKPLLDAIENTKDDEAIEYNVPIGAKLGGISIAIQQLALRHKLQIKTVNDYPNRKIYLMKGK